MKYIAFLRGIGPGDPRMRNDKLRSVFESLGFTSVQSVISSGNIIFSTDDPPSGIEQRIEQALFDMLGFHSTTVIRSQAEIDKLVASRPFGEREHGPTQYLLVTFLKSHSSQLSLGGISPDGSGRVIGYDQATSAILTITDPTAVKTPDIMAWLEKQLGKQITSRTWKTIERIHKKLLQ